jgi:hypothetical protein
MVSFAEEFCGMAKLAKAELVRYRAELSEWRTPAAMADYVGAVNDTMGSADFFRQGGVEFLRGVRPPSAKHISPVRSPR